MRKHTFFVFSLIGGMALALPLSQFTKAAEKRPVANGLRTVAEGTADLTRRAGQATKQTAGAIVDGTARTLERTGEAARNMRDNTRARLQGDAPNQSQNRNAYQGEYSAQYRGQGSASNSGEATAPENQAMQNSQSWESDSMNNQAYNNGRVYTLRHDASGREFICVQGQRVYFDNSQTTEQPYEARKPITEQRQDNRADEQGPAMISDQPTRAGDNANTPPAPPVPAGQENAASNLDREMDRAESNVENKASDSAEKSKEMKWNSLHNSESNLERDMKQEADFLDEQSKNVEQKEAN